MNKRLLITMTALMFVATTMMAVPAKPGLKKKVTLKDGTTVELSLKGDEHFSYYTDAAGKPCKLKNGELIKLTREEVVKQWTALREQRLAIGNSSSRRAHRVGEPSTTTGTHKGLVILLQYQDVKFSNDSLTTNKIFKRFFNEEGYKEYGNEGSVRDYFKKQSYGKLNIDFDVVGPFTVSNKMEYYGKHYTDDQGKEHNDAHPAIMVAEGVDFAYKAGINFSNYDWDGDKEVDQVFVIYAGYAEAQGAAPETIWPHEWSLSVEGKTKEYNGVTINTYGCASELSGKSGSDLDGIGTACHEFTHCLGLPDMYDTQGDNYGMAYWDVMCAGSYNDNSHTPAGYTAYERWFAGWMQPKEINSMTRVEKMEPLAREAEAYVLYNDKNKNEYYLLENRQAIDFDKGLSGHGLLILHVDYNESAWVTNTVNITEGHERMTIIPADNVKLLSSSSLAGDPWPGTSGNTALSNYSTPAATLYNKNSDGSKLMNKPIGNIMESSDGLISFVVCHPGVEPPVFSGDATETSDGFTINWSAVTDATSYEIELTEIPAASKDTAEAKYFATDFSKCYSKSTGFSDISSKLSSYGLPSGWSGSKLYTSPNGLKVGTNSATGSISSPWYKASESGEYTIVLGTSSESTKGNLTFTTADTEGQSVLTETAVEQSVDFEFSKPGRMVFNFKSTQGAYKQNFTFKEVAYLNYYAIYYGTFNAKELGIEEETGKVVSKRRASTTTLSTSNTNYTFSGLNKTSTFQYRVRAIGPEVTSGWSEQQTFKFSTTGIKTISADTDNTVRYYDLQGREVDRSSRGLIIRKQGSKVEKVIVK